MTRNELAPESAAEPLRADKKFILTVVAQNGLALQFTVKTLQADKDIVLMAATHNELGEQQSKVKPQVAPMSRHAELRNSSAIQHDLSTLC